MNNGFDEIVSNVSPHARELAERARSLIQAVCPAVVEVPWPKQKVIGYGVGPKKMSEHFSYISVSKNHINLGFMYGAELPDPKGLLEGAGKLLRHVRITQTEQLSNPALRQLLEVASKHLMPAKASGSKAEQQSIETKSLAFGPKDVEEKMKQTAPKTIDEYISDFPADIQDILERIRATIKKAAPKAQETISYGIPAFTLRDTYLIYFAGYKKHIAIYPVPTGNAEFNEEISPYQTGKGTLQFPLDNSIPYSLIRKLVKHSLQDNLIRAEAKLKKKGRS